jgi:putative AdoMet-dependent methyltransferase
MSLKPKWFYDELKPSGVDYTDPAQVEKYDQDHQRFRDYQKAAAVIIEQLELKPEHSLIDMGAGTGAFALHAASHCRQVYAVDVSAAMLAYTRQKAQQMGLTNIVFCHGGFLTYKHQAEPVEALVSVAALHHLPDFWKLVGLRRAAAMLKPGGRLYLFDVVFPDVADYAPLFDQWVQSLATTVGAEFAVEVETHIRDEYSTYDWVMEGFLQRAGLQINQANYADNFSATYLCTRIS